MGLTGFVFVFLGGGLGAAARHGVTLLSARWLGVNYPFGTFAVNILGAFAIGVVFEYLAIRTALPQATRLFLITGVIGGFTTFSTFILEIGLLYERGQLTIGVLYAAASMAFGLAALFAGSFLVRSLTA